MIIPIEQLNEDTLFHVIREWLMREGEDWALAQTSLDSAIEQARRALFDGKLVLLWDESDETLNIVDKNELKRC